MSFYVNIGFHWVAPLPDARAIEYVVNNIAFDWIRYSSHCYLIWTDKEPSYWAIQLRRIPNMENSNFLVSVIEPLSKVDGWLPEWAWQWILKEKTLKPMPPPSEPKSLSERLAEQLLKNKEDQ